MTSSFQRNLRRRFYNNQQKIWQEQIAIQTEANIRTTVVDNILAILDADPVISVYPTYTGSIRNDIDNERNTP